MSLSADKQTASVEAGTEPQKNDRWRVVADACFRFRAISVVPVVLLIFFIFAPVDAGRFNSILNAGGFLIALIGAATRINAVGHAKPYTSGRENFLRAESLNTSGLYSIVRNPLYVGNFLVYNGLLIAYFSPGALVFFNVFFIINYHFIILSEERYLENQFGQAYRDYLLRVPKVLPRFSLYRKNDHPFRLARAVYKEKNTTFYWVSFFAVTLLVKQYKLNNGVIVHFWQHAVPVLLLFALNVILTLSRKPKPA